jgi:hypothetical protein
MASASWSSFFFQEASWLSKLELRKLISAQNSYPPSSAVL